VNEEKWFQKIDQLKPPRSGGMKEIRLYGGAFTLVQHWISFKNEAGQIKRFAKLCSGFNFEEATFYEDRFDRCTLCKHFNDRSLPKYLQFRPKFDYLHDAFDMEAIKNGSRSDLVGSIQINSYGLQDLQNTIDSLSKRKDKELQQIDDPERGFSVMWKHNPNAKDAKLKQGFSEGDHTPIRYSSKKEKFYLPESDEHDYDGVWGPLTDFLEILSADIPTSEEIEEDIRRLKIDEKYEEATGIAIFGRSRKSPDSGSDGDWGGEEDEEEAPPRRTRRKKADEDWDGEEEASPPKQASSSDDDWDEGEEEAPPKRSRRSEEDEEEAPRRTRRRREEPAQEAKEDDDWDSDKEEEEAPRRTRRRREEPAQEAKEDDDWDSDKDEEEAPPKRSRRRAKPQVEDDDWDEAKDDDQSEAKSAKDDDWEDDPPPKKGRSRNGKRRSSKKNTEEEEEEAPPDNKRRVSSGDAEEDEWESSPRRNRRSSESDDPPTRPSRRKGRALSRASDWE
jgi:hypothetical protein